MTTAEFIRRFEADDIPADSFHHSDHVRLAFAYLSADEPLVALGKFSAALRRFAAARGKPGLYHEAAEPAEAVDAERVWLERPPNPAEELGDLAKVEQQERLKKKVAILRKRFADRRTG